MRCLYALRTCRVVWCVRELHLLTGWTGALEIIALAEGRGDGECAGVELLAGQGAKNLKEDGGVE